jgi:hypothetical protein
MPKHLQILAGVAFGIIARDLVTRPIRTKYNILLQHHAECVDAYNSLHDQMNYLCHLLNEHDITLDEFDQIALPNVKIVEKD